MDIEERNRIIGESDEHWSELAHRFDLSRSSIYRIQKEYQEAQASSEKEASRRRGVSRYATTQPTISGKSSTAIYDQMATSGLRRFGGEIQEEWQEELRGESGLATYAEMSTHPVVAAVLFAIEMSLRRVKWTIEPNPDAEDEAEAEKAAEFVEQCWKDMSQSPTDIISQIFRPMIKYGFVVAELVYKKRLGQDPPNYVDDPAASKYDDDRIGWRRWQFINPFSLSPYNRWIFDENKRVQGVRQSGGIGQEDVRINMKKLLLFRTTTEFDNPEGISSLRAMFMPWFYARHLTEIEAIGAERVGVGLPVMYLNQECSFEGSDSDFKMAKDIVTNVRADEQAGIVVPAAKMGTQEAGEPAMSFELVSPPAKGAIDFTESIDRHEKRMAMCVLGQFIFLGMARVGTQALASTQTDFFVEAVGAWSDGAADVINRFGIPRLMRYNGWKDPLVHPVMHHSEAGVPDLFRLAQFVNQIVRQPVLEPYEGLRDYLLEVADLPERSEKDKQQAPPVVQEPQKEKAPPTGGLGPGEQPGRPRSNAPEGASETFSHEPRTVKARCPLCLHNEAYYYGPDHGSAVVCAACGRTYDMEME